MLIDDQKEQKNKGIDSAKEQPRDIMHYESDIWAVADDLIAVSIKQSDFPTYMMPFFALMMLEGRMRNAVAKVTEKYHLTPEQNPDDFREAFVEEGCGCGCLMVIAVIAVIAVIIALIFL